MCSNNNEKPFKADVLEEWLESFFLDPFTSILDQSQFRVDIFDTETEMIIEALLPYLRPEEIYVYVDGPQVKIKAGKRTGSNKERIITFPFNINTQKVSAVFSNEILEIIISKIYQVGQQNRHIPVL